MTSDTRDSNTFFALLFRQKYIRRWAMMRNTSDENLSSHTAECAFIAHALCEIGNAVYGRSYDLSEIVLCALYHDAAEVITGDLPTPIKYYSRDLRSSYGEIEKNASAALLSKLPAELRPAYSKYLDESSFSPEALRIVKAADRLCAYIKCIEEEKSGNTEFRSAKNSVYDWLCSHSFEELDYFIVHLLPAFSLTLDEL